MSDKQDDRPPLALIAARAEYIYRLEKLLDLQESDLKTNEDYLEENRQLLSNRDLKLIETLIKYAKELVEHTRMLIALAELQSLTENDDLTINRHKEPYNQGILLRVLSLNALPEEEIRAAIEMRGVDFEINPIDERELVNAGASEQLLRLIRSSHRR